MFFSGIGGTSPTRSESDLFAQPDPPSVSLEDESEELAFDCETKEREPTSEKEEDDLLKIRDSINIGKEFTEVDTSSDHGLPGCDWQAPPLFPELIGVSSSFLAEGQGSKNPSPTLPSSVLPNEPSPEGISSLESPKSTRTLFKSTPELSERVKRIEESH